MNNKEFLMNMDSFVFDYNSQGKYWLRKDSWTVTNLNADHIKCIELNNMRLLGFNNDDWLMKNSASISPIKVVPFPDLVS